MFMEISLMFPGFVIVFSEVLYCLCCARNSLKTIPLEGEFFG